MGVGVCGGGSMWELEWEYGSVHMGVWECTHGSMGMGVCACGVHEIMGEEPSGRGRDLALVTKS